MDALAALVTIAAGVAMGAINNVAGGAGVFGLVAFELACGLPLAIANPSMRPAALCVGVFAFLGYWRAGARVPSRTFLLGLWALPGAPLGSWLALHLPDGVFWGYLAVVLGQLLWQQLHAGGVAERPRRDRPWACAAGCFLVGVHMGYAQVGVGLLCTLVLTATSRRTLLEVTAAKSALVVVASVASIGSFATASAIAVGPAVALAIGTAFGSYHASRWAVARGSSAVRRVVVTVTAAMVAYSLWKLVAIAVAAS